MFASIIIFNVHLTYFYWERNFTYSLLCSFRAEGRRFFSRLFFVFWSLNNNFPDSLLNTYSQYQISFTFECLLVTWYFFIQAIKLRITIIIFKEKMFKLKAATAHDRILQFAVQSVGMFLQASRILTSQRWCIKDKHGTVKILKIQSSSIGLRSCFLVICVPY